VKKVTKEMPCYGVKKQFKSTLKVKNATVVVPPYIRYPNKIQDD
jgi:hypothetical protein